MKRINRRIIMICIIVVTASPLFIFHIIPKGIVLSPKQYVTYLFFCPEKEIVSPGGMKLLTKVNDGGAMHSGNHYTLILTKHWWGKKVISQGWIDSGYWKEPFFTWIGNDKIQIDYVTARYDDTKIPEIVILSK